MNFFKSSSSKIKTPSELVRSTREAIQRLDSASTSAEGKRKASEDMSKNLFQMKLLLYGDGENEPQPELIAQLAQEVYAKDILQLLVLHIWRFEFEARKDVSQIFNNLLRRQIGSRWPTVEYLSAKEETIFAALKGYENAEVALNTGMILREMLRHEPLARTLLYSDRFYDFIDYIEQTTFGIACDAQANFKETLTRHKSMVAGYLDENYDRFFSSYALLVQSTNYVTKRQSLKLLGEILLDRTNFKVMTRYIANEENLKMMMNLLKDRSKNIQFEAFHVFKVRSVLHVVEAGAPTSSPVIVSLVQVFVANPKKPPQIEAILKRNRMKLVTFLQGFHNDRDDEQFTDEKAFLIQQLQQL
ncbi:BZ3500_MvSof-1268-A1-R1_Chr4-1g06706 [Microbotryum saponariae]|uniref:BZ3500_MvSof-1268-A1-R1_Chr4-1g06706 protein n=1 Tax=Microbotryum saponariae TaxID=289078 RepID=A0A2X0LHB5_9BASI|nr:BZ3500_MvSof-1268-A1-R1_Chr4-1g06706 [Microbotryum saponariae]SDA06371.1 BZ3501_MvSof-1269-A2-R1_Chr4-1g06416 [Microbotryum saponariae]